MTGFCYISSRSHQSSYKYSRWRGMNPRFFYNPLKKKNNSQAIGHTLHWTDAVNTGALDLSVPIRPVRRYVEAPASLRKFTVYSPFGRSLCSSAKETWGMIETNWNHFTWMLSVSTCRLTGWSIPLNSAYKSGDWKPIGLNNRFLQATYPFCQTFRLTLNKYKSLTGQYNLSRDVSD